MKPFRISASVDVSAERICKILDSAFTAGHRARWLKDVEIVHGHLDSPNTLPDLSCALTYVTEGKKQLTLIRFDDVLDGLAQLANADAAAFRRLALGSLDGPDAEMLLRYIICRKN